MDFDGDGIEDFISGSYDPGDLYLFRGLGKGEYAAAENLVDKAGTHLVHHPERLIEYERLSEDPDADKEATIQARIASFGSWAAAVDWEADGDLDLLIGSFGGGLFLRLNEGTRTEPVYSTESIPVRADGAPFKVSGHANPVVADWDGDGLWDLVVSASDGSVAWYRNTGDETNPSFAAGETLVEARASSKFLFQCLAPDETPQPGVRAQICVTDYDGDGDLDLIVGDYSDISRQRADLEPGERSALAALIQKYAASSTEERFELLPEFTAFAGESKRHSFIWLYRRVGAPELHGQAPAEPPFEVAVEAPTWEAPVNAGMGVTPKPAQPGDVIDVAVRIRVAEGWHIYDLDGPAQYMGTELTLELPEGLEPIGTWLRPASHAYPKELGLRVWTGDVLFRHRVRVDRLPAAGSEIGCTLSYQTCNADYCLPPSEEALTVAYGGSTDESGAWAPHRGTRVLYAGKAGGHREAVFGAFLKEWFDESATLPLAELSMETARDYDVVIVDWMSQYGNDGYPEREGGLHGVPVKLGAKFTKPFIAMTYVGTQLRGDHKLDWL